MTPNIGQGANSAIESAAVLANKLYELRRTHTVGKPSDDQMKSTLKEFNNSRLQRVKSTVKEAGFLTRLQARDGVLNCFIGRYIVPYAGDFPASHASKVVRAAPKLDFLPSPSRASEYWESKPRQSIIKRESLKKAALFILRACISSAPLIPALPASLYVSPPISSFSRALMTTSTATAPFRAPRR